MKIQNVLFCLLTLSVSLTSCLKDTEPALPSPSNPYLRVVVNGSEWVAPEVNAQLTNDNIIQVVGIDAISRRVVGIAIDASRQPGSYSITGNNPESGISLYYIPGSGNGSLFYSNSASVRIDQIDIEAGVISGEFTFIASNANGDPVATLAGGQFNAAF